MEMIFAKLGTILSAIITVLGGFYMYERKVTHDRLRKLEQDVSQTKTDIKVIETRFDDLKEDTKELKEGQKQIIDMLAKRHK